VPIPFRRQLNALLIFSLSLPIAFAQGQIQVAGQPSQADQFQVGKVSRGGFDLYYRTLGEGEPVLILSGGPGDDCDYMVPVAQAVAKSARAILLEPRGTGRSIPQVLDKSTIGLALYLDDLEALRQQLNVQHWVLVGHSAGGLLAMYYAAAHPDRVDKLVLLDSAPVASEFLRPLQDNILDRLSPGDRDRLATLQASDSPEALALAAQLQAQALFFDRKVGSHVAAMIGTAWHPAVGRLLGSEMTASGYDLRPRLKDFDRPVLVLNGRQDPMDPLMAFQTSAAFKKSTLRFIDRAGHFPWFEQEHEFDDMLVEFLK
jgi:proline iminopeptidase